MRAGNTEPQPPYIIIANHASALDIPLVALAVGRPVRFMFKHELTRPLPLRLWIQSLGGFFVRRGAGDRAALDTALMSLARGQVVCLFPEGTRSPDGRLLTLRSGAAYLALQTGVPVLAVAIIGAHHVMPKGANWPRGGPVVMKIGVPLRPRRVIGPVPRAMAQEWTARFAGALTELLPPDQRPVTSPAHALTARCTPLSVERATKF